MARKTPLSVDPIAEAKRHMAERGIAVRLEG